MVAIATTTSALSSSVLLLWFCALLTTTTTTFSIIEGVDAAGSSSTLPETVFWDNNWPSDLTLPRKAGDNNENNNDNNGADLWSLSSDAYVISGQTALNEVDNDPNSDELTDIFNTNNADGGVGTYAYITQTLVFIRFVLLYCFSLLLLTKFKLLLLYLSLSLSFTTVRTLSINYRSFIKNLQWCMDW
jgi:hypothetical protein